MQKLLVGGEEFGDVVVVEVNGKLEIHKHEGDVEKSNGDCADFEVGLEDALEIERDKVEHGPDYPVLEDYLLVLLTLLAAGDAGGAEERVEEAEAEVAGLNEEVLQGAPEHFYIL